MELMIVNNMHMATQKQLEYIEAIEQACGIEFVGRTKQEASEYISEYKAYLDNDKDDGVYWY